MLNQTPVIALKNNPLRQRLLPLQNGGAILMIGRDTVNCIFEKNQRILAAPANSVNLGELRVRIQHQISHILRAQIRQCPRSRSFGGTIVTYQSSERRIFSTIFLASPNSIIVLSRKNSSFCTPA